MVAVYSRHEFRYCLDSLKIIRSNDFSIQPNELDPKNILSSQLTDLDGQPKSLFPHHSDALFNYLINVLALFLFIYQSQHLFRKGRFCVYVEMDCIS